MQSSVSLLSSVSLSPAVRVKCRTPTTTTTTTTVNDPNSMAAAAPKWAQKTITLPPLKRGCHLITPKIVKEIGQDLSGFNCGLAHLFLQHTSASLTINENYDSDVRDDTETFLNRIVPEGSSAPWKHTLEGPDDMPAHIKSSMFGNTLTIPITNGKLNMGTWQAKDSSGSSSVEFCQSPQRWVLRAIHTNPSCTRYWKVLQKLVE